MDQFINKGDIWGKIFFVNNGAQSHEIRGIPGMKTVANFPAVFQVLRRILSYAFP